MTDHAFPAADAAQPTRRFGFVLWLLLLLALVGLAAVVFLTMFATSSVSGTVTLDGKPLTTGLVSFHPVEKGPIANGRLNRSGEYSLNTGGSRGIARGSYRVTIAANQAEGSAAAVEGGGSPILPLITPPMYAEQETSGLRAEVGWGTNRLDFAISSDSPGTDEGR